MSVKEHMMNTYTVFWAHDWGPLQTVLTLPPDRLPDTPEGWIGLALADRDPDLTPEDAAAQLDAGGWVLVAVCDGLPTGPVIEGAAPMTTELPDGDYVLAEGAAWLDLPVGERTATLRVRRNAGRDARCPSDPGVIVEVYRQGEEDRTALAALFVAQDDLEPEDDPEAPSLKGPNDERM